MCFLGTHAFVLAYVCLPAQTGSCSARSPSLRTRELPCTRRSRLPFALRLMMSCARWLARAWCFVYLRVSQGSVLGALGPFVLAHRWFLILVLSLAPIPRARAQRFCVCPVRARFACTCTRNSGRAARPGRFGPCKDPWGPAGAESFNRRLGRCRYAARSAVRCV